MRILVVEDSPANQKIAVRLLQKRGHEVYLAENGKEALRQLAAVPVDLVMMDIHMPEMDGVQATMEIRRQIDSPMGQIPIVAVSAHNSREDQERCLAAGMDAFLPKPIDVRQLVDLVERLADRSSKDRSTVTDVQADFNGLFTQLGNDVHAFLDFARVFWNDTASWLDRAKTAARQEQFEDLAIAAGCLESQARSVGSGCAAEMAYELRGRALAQDRIDSVAELDKLSREFLALRSALARFCASLPGRQPAVQDSVG